MPIVVEHLTFNYSTDDSKAAPALDDISIRIEDGEFLGVIGHTGSGKSTFIQHLNGLLQPTQGKITVNGIDLRERKRRKEVRKQVGMVFQYPEYQLFDETIEKDIAFGPRNVGVPEDEIDSCVRIAMEKVALDYDKFAHKSPFELSGGQKRRVALAGILAMNPSILVLDEPMAGLDPRGRKEILDIIKSFHQENKTVIMVSHSMEDIASLAQRVAVMNKGKLVALDEPRKVFEKQPELNAIGLDAPQAARVVQKLRDKGFDIPKGIYRFEDLCDYVAGAGGLNAQ